MSLTYYPEKQQIDIDGVMVTCAELFKLSKDQGVAIATWRRLRRENPPKTLIEQVNEDIDKEILTKLITRHKEFKRDSRYVAVVCRLRELHSIGRYKGRPA